MVLRYWYIQHENKKRQQEADARELAPYLDYLDEAIERMLAQERAVLARRRARRRHIQISLLEALVKLPLKSLETLESRFWEAQYPKTLADELKREFRDWLRTTKPYLDSHDPQEHVRRFSEIYKGPILKAYEEGYEEGREESRRNRAAALAKSTRHDGNNEI